MHVYAQVKIELGITFVDFCCVMLEQNFCNLYMQKKKYCSNRNYFHIYLIYVDLIRFISVHKDIVAIAVKNINAGLHYQILPGI